MKNYIEEKILEFDYFTSFFGEMHQNLKANNANPTQISNHWRGGNTSKFILWGQHYPDTEAKQRCQKEIKLQANISNEHRLKYP